MLAITTNDSFLLMTKWIFAKGKMMQEDWMYNQREAGSEKSALLWQKLKMRFIQLSIALGLLHNIFAYFHVNTEETKYVS